MISWEKSLSPSFVNHIMSFSCFLTNYAAKFFKNDFRSLKLVIEADYICNFNFKWQLISYSLKHFWQLRIQLQFICYFLSLTSRRGIYMYMILKKLYRRYNLVRGMYQFPGPSVICKHNHLAPGDRTLCRFHSKENCFTWKTELLVHKHFDNWGPRSQLFSLSASLLDSIMSSIFNSFG